MARIDQARPSLIVRAARTPFVIPFVIRIPALQSNGLLTRKSWKREHVLTECWGPGTEGRPDTHAAVRTSKWKYVEHYQDPQRTTVRSHKAGGQDVELYDLDADPHELDNLLRLDADGLKRTGKTQADVDAQVKELKVELERLKKE